MVGVILEMKVMMVYHTKTGHTLEAVNATSEGIRSAGSEADQVTAQAFDPAQLADYDALIIASPCWAGSAGLPMLPKPLVRALTAISADALQDKLCGGISVHSGMGGENTITRVGEILAQKGCTNYQPGPVARAGVPFSVFKGPSVKPKDEALFKAFGAAFVA